MKQFLNSKLWVWGLLSLPMVPILIVLVTGNTSNGAPATEALLHPTGEFSARLLYITLMITPLQMIFPQARFIRWLRRNRRYFGVASFLYALLHLVLYLVDMGALQAIWKEFWLLSIFTGWLAFFIMVPLALTSNDRAVKAMGRRWKALQKWAYAAAILTFVHWAMVHNNTTAALINVLPLLLLESYRIIKITTRRSRHALE